MLVSLQLIRCNLYNNSSTKGREWNYIGAKFLYTIEINPN